MNIIWKSSVKSAKYMLYKIYYRNVGLCPFFMLKKMKWLIHGQKKWLSIPICIEK